LFSGQYLITVRSGVNDFSGKETNKLSSSSRCAWRLSVLSFIG
jgi:hypothetical protein